jgi:GAF domain/ANTAR domain
MIPKEAALVRTLVELSDSLTDDFDVPSMLSVLCERCAEVLGAAGTVVMLETTRGKLRLAASSFQKKQWLALFARDGPWVECYRSGQPTAWTDFPQADPCVGHWYPEENFGGFHSIHSVPMRHRDRSIGALSVLAVDKGSLDPADLAAAQALADIATIAILQHSVAIDAQILHHQLTQALDSRIVIEQAKGRISQAASIDMDQAFQRLRRYARSHNRRLAEVSSAIASGALSPLSPDPLTSQTPPTQEAPVT